MIIFFKRVFFCLFLTVLTSNLANAQEGESELGAWYGFFWNTNFGSSDFGLTGDIQHRNYSVTNDFQQLILRAGLSYNVKNTPLKVVAGYAYFNSGTFGESNSQLSENRLYQDALLDQQIGNRTYLTHRFRLEERFVEDQDFRTRFRYMLAVQVPLNQKTITKNAVFFSAFSEIFINGQKDIGDGRSVPLFDRNWLFGGLGYVFTNTIRAQVGYQRETTESFSKGQLIVGLFCKI